MCLNKELNRFPELRPQLGGRQYPTPPWVVSKARQAAIDALAGDERIRVPREWPAIRQTFAHVGFMKTVEAIQYAGPVGYYFLYLMDMEETYKRAFVKFFQGMEPLCRKVSTPEVRRTTRKKLTNAMFDLEMLLPHRWTSMVRHVMSDHAVDTLERCGPFVVHNMLCREAFQGVIKSLCRGRQAMASIRNHAKLWEASMIARRSMPETEWSVHANRSTADSQVIAGESASRFGLVAAPVGKKLRRKDLDQGSFRQVTPM